MKRIFLIFFILLMTSCAQPFGATWVTNGGGTIQDLVDNITGLFSLVNFFANNLTVSGTTTTGALTIGSTLIPSTITTSAIEFSIDGGGTVVTTGIKSGIEVPFSCTLNQVTIITDVADNCTVYLLKKTYASLPATIADNMTLTGTVLSTATTLTKYQITSLTGWTILVNAGDWIFPDVTACSAATKITVSLKVTR